MTWTLIERCESQARRMGEMLERMQVDVVGLARGSHGGEFSRARNACMACGKTAECDSSNAAWRQGSAEATDPETFCANAELFAAHRASR